MKDLRVFQPTSAHASNLPPVRRLGREYSPYSAYKSMSDESDQDMTYEMAKGLYQQSGGAATGNGSE